MNRRQFLRTAAAAALAAQSPALFSSEPARRKAPYRVLYSNDTTNTVSCASPWHKKGQPFKAELLDATVDEVTGSGVEVHLLQPGLGWIPWWKSKVYPAEEHYRWYKERTGHSVDTYGDYMLGGGDMVKVFIERCRQRQQVPFISLRMNDGHHLEHVHEKHRNAIWSSRFYVEHLNDRIGTDPLRFEQHVLNWAVPEVRAHKLSFIQELCENYDFAGLEMDFMRFYSLFQLDKTTLEQRRSIITSFVKQVREVLDRAVKGSRRWLCVRVPCYFEALDAMGMDLPAMVDAGVDMVNLSASYFTLQQTDLAAIRRSIPSAAVYLEMCHSIWNGKKLLPKGYDTFQFRRATPEQCYTTAHLAYARGADGVSAFNFVYYREHGSGDRGPFAEPPFHIFKHLGDREWLARQPQHYFLSQAWVCPYAKKRSVLPQIVTSGKPVKFNIDLAPPAGGWQNGGRLRIQAEVAFGESRWKATLNGVELEPSDDVSEPYPNPYPSLLGKPEELRAWKVPAKPLRDGINKIELSMMNTSPMRLVFLDAALS